MLTERARVTDIIENAAGQVSAVHVVADARVGCARCEAGQGCGGGVLGKLVQRKQRAVVAANPGKIALTTGQAVLIGLDERVAARGALLVYLMPLGTMLLGALFASIFSAADSVAAVGGGLGLAAGFIAARAFTARSGHRARPVVLGVADAECGTFTLTSTLA